MRFMNVKMAADETDLSTATLRRYIASGALRARRVGRRVLIDEQDLRAFIEGNESERAVRRSGGGGGDERDAE